ncbi:MAG: DUF4169 family protein [Rhodobacteraceae bacterium]|nr:DUF4169 family protein [Paracoccaceae bacterium]
MAETPISLSKFRKTRARADKKAQADANAVRFGRSKADKARDAAQAAQQDAHLNAHRRDDAPDR